MLSRSIGKNRVYILGVVNSNALLYTLILL